MSIPPKRLFGSLLASICILFSWGQPALAASLTPGGIVAIPAANTPARTVVLTARPFTIQVGLESVVGTVNDLVTTFDGTGTMAFETQVIVTHPLDTAMIDRVSRTGFDGFSTDISYLPNSNFYPPSFAARSPVSGSDAQWIFTPSIGAIGLIRSPAIPYRSDYVVIATDATAYALVGTIRVGASVGTTTYFSDAISAYAPVELAAAALPAIPEPSEHALFLVGLLGVAWAARRRRARGVLTARSPVIRSAPNGRRYPVWTSISIRHFARAAGLLPALALATSLQGCGYFFYQKTPSGAFEGELHVEWIAPNLFVYRPDKEHPLTYTTSDHKTITPQLMYTDGGSIPRLFWSAPNFGPWDFAPGYIVHDWLFEQQHCKVGDWESVSFDRSALLLAESMKTQMEKGGKPEPDVVYLVYEAVRSPIAHELWRSGKCVLPPAAALITTTPVRILTIKAK